MKKLTRLSIILLLAACTAASAAACGTAAPETENSSTADPPAGTDAAEGVPSDAAAAENVPAGAAAPEDTRPVIRIVSESPEEKSSAAAGKTGSDSASPEAPGSGSASPAAPESAGRVLPAAPDGTFTITFAGDILMDPGYAAGDALTKRGAAGCFDEDALSLMRGSDLFVVNNEFAYTSGGKAVSKKFNFRADPKHAHILTDMGADLVTLGNNHTYDYGEEGLLDTLDTLEREGIPYIGAGRTQEEAESPFVFTVGGFRVSLLNAEAILFNNSAPAQSAQGDKPGTFDSYRPEMLYEAVRRAKADSDYCIVIMHWGSEGKSTPNEKQLALSKGAAEAGADLIIGGHPHVLQGISLLGNVPVCYSLGNYLFHSGTYDTGVIQAVLRPSDRRLETLRFVPMQCRNMKVYTLSGNEKERLLSDMRSLSPGTQIDDDGRVGLPGH